MGPVLGQTGLRCGGSGGREENFSVWVFGERSMLFEED